VDAAFAALVAIMVHSVVDVFYGPPMLLLMALLAAYVVGTLPAPPPTGAARRRAYAVALLIVIVIYGVGLLLSDRAQRTYQQSVFEGDIALARAAAAQDPYLNLYRLNIADLLGRSVFEDDGTADPDALPDAIAAYETALALEPSWGIGWLNLAALEEQRGNLELAYEYAQTADDISFENGAGVHAARFAEATDALPEHQLITRTARAIEDSLRNQVGLLPLADYWDETEVRRQATLTYAADIRADRADRAYLIEQQFAPALAAARVPVDPQTATDWMIVGYAAADDAVRYDAFDRAIALEPYYGDAYVERGRAALALGRDTEAVRLDASTGMLLGARRGTGAALLAEAAATPEARRNNLLRAVPTRENPQYFAAVMYNGRIGNLQPLPTVNAPLLAEEQLQPWYTLAALLTEAGETASAARVYRMILYADPEQERAREALGALER